MTRAAVIDIGSNSIRLVVYEGPGRAAGRSPVTLFNEKVLCGLGRGLGATGRLNPDGARMALANLARFKMLAERMGVARIDALATAAVRDAADGAAFVAEVKARVGLAIDVLDGAEEARLSALGVVAGIPDAAGVMGDLGGGSLELVAIERGRADGHVTLPLGPLRLAEPFAGDVKAARTMVDDQLDGLAWLRQQPGRSFYAVGGAWRSLARFLMEDRAYPLHMIHHYALPAAEALPFLRRIARFDPDDLRRRAARAKRRIETLPWAALVLERLLVRAEVETLTFSAYGLREGALYDRLDPATRAQDPLLAGAALVAAEGRFPLSGEELYAFLAPILVGVGPRQRRLAHAAALLSDIGWREHPDYRHEHAYLRALRLPLTGADHAERAWLAIAVAARYGSLAGDIADDAARRLLSEALAHEAEAVGLALRLGYTLSGGAPGILPTMRLEPVEQHLMLSLPGPESEAIGDAVTRRFDALARHLGLTPRLVWIG